MGWCGQSVNTRRLLFTSLTHHHHHHHHHHYTQYMVHSTQYTLRTWHMHAYKYCTVFPYTHCKPSQQQHTAQHNSTTARGGTAARPCPPRLLLGNGTLRRLSCASVSIIIFCIIVIVITPIIVRTTTGMDGCWAPHKKNRKWDGRQTCTQYVLWHTRILYITSTVHTTYTVYCAETPPNRPSQYCITDPLIRTYNTVYRQF